MPTSQITPGILLFLLTATLWWDAPLADAQTLDADAGPQAVVARWLELHRAGNRDEASALTTGTQDHRANVLLSSRRAADVRVERSLGNERAAAVVTNALDDSRDGERVLLFWLARRDGAWRINKSDLFERKVVDERLRGFLEAEDVRWHVPRDQLQAAGSPVPADRPESVESLPAAVGFNSMTTTIFGLRPGARADHIPITTVSYRANGGSPTANSCCHIRISSPFAESRGLRTTCWSSSGWTNAAR